MITPVGFFIGFTLFGIALLVAIVIIDKSTSL